MSDRQRTPRLRVIAASALAVALAFGMLLFAAVPAQAVGPVRGLVCIDSVTCNPENLPLLVEAGIVTGTATTGAVAATVATGGVAALSGYAGVGILSAFVLLAGGSTVAAVLAQHGVATGTHLKTAVGSGSAAIVNCPATITLGLGTPTATETGGFAGNCTDPVQELVHKFGAGTVDALTVTHTFSVVGTTEQIHMVGVGTIPSGYSGSPTNTGQLQCYYVTGSTVTRSTSPMPTGAGTNNYTCNLTLGGVALQSIVYEQLDSSETHRLYIPLWSPNFIPGAAGWHGTIRSTLVCKGPSGASRNVVVSVAVDASGGDDLTVPPAQCAKGELAGGLTVDFAPTTNPTGWIPLATATTPGAVVSLIDTYPDCFGPGVEPCSMTLYHLRGTTTTSCGDHGQYCPGWASDPNASDNYQCRYGLTVLDLTYCSAFRAPSVGPLPNYDLATSTPVPITAPVPSSLPNQVTDPDGDPTTLPDGGTGDEESNDCWPTGWGVLNPAAWVLQPIQCAFKWAFSPDPAAIEADTTEINDAWQSTPPGLIIAAVAGWTIVPPASGCDGITVDISWIHVAGVPSSFQVMQACPGDMLATMAGWSKVFMDLAFIVGAVLAITRYVGGIIAFGGLGKGDES
jgi:hypothetical protein